MRIMGDEIENSRADDENSSAKPARDFTAQIPEISLPNSGGAIRSIGEKFTLNPATGSGNISIPIAMTPGRGAPQLSLNYDLSLIHI